MRDHWIEKIILFVKKPHPKDAHYESRYYSGSQLMRFCKPISASLIISKCNIIKLG
jgi:hypothetical protein